MNNNNDNGEEMGICSRCGDCVEKNLMDQHINNTCSSYIFDMSSSPSSKISNFPKAKTFFQGSQSPNQIKKIKPNNSKVEFLPLSSKVRPSNLDSFVGQDELIGEKGILRNLILLDKIPSMILFGNSGTGKTTLARIIANTTNSVFKEFSGTSHGSVDIKKAFDEAKNEQKLLGHRTIIFLDEIHRFNKAQQDLFLPYIESGSVTLIGATTENPSFKINSALLNDESLKFLAVISDARVALNALEVALNMSKREPRRTKLNKDDIKKIFQKSHLLYDKDGEEHYNIISALHKSMRGSDPNASLYWLGRMLTAGEDPLYIARRLIVFASEDVGLADNSALPLAISTYQACQFIGMPECEINLAHCVVYLAEAKKSIRSYKAYKLVKEYAYPVPLHIRNAPTGLMKELGYGEGYKYNPGYEGPVYQEYLPLELKNKVFLDVEGEKNVEYLSKPLGYSEDHKNNEWEEPLMLKYYAIVTVMVEAMNEW
ncbi:10244_t:CDS:10 [Entrophospora sp. SA101]|nr:10244_t:CDS:10 [Entrophospora sp. SA101]